MLNDEIMRCGERRTLIEVSSTAAKVHIEQWLLQLCKRNSATPELHLEREKKKNC